MRDHDNDPENGEPLGRRTVMRAALAGLGGLATVGLLPLAGREAEAVPSDPGAGPPITGDPIKAKIQKSGVAVELVTFSTPPRTAAAPPYAFLNYLHHAGDGSGRLFCADSRGKIWLIDPTTGATKLFFDLAKARGAAFICPRWTMGLRTFAFHPDFAKSGKPGHGKFYTVNTESPSGYQGGVLFSDSYPVDHHDVVAEWSVKSGNVNQADPGSRREILRTAVYGVEHNADQLLFDPNAKSGSAGYGKMLISVGDGGNRPHGTDPYNQAQNLGRALGKLLRIDPLQQGVKPYGIPSDNPFASTGGGVLPEIWAYGLRHPQTLSYDPATNGVLLIGEIGQRRIEEVNLGVSGANYGWPLREGVWVTDRTTVSTLYGLPSDDAKNKFTYPVAEYDHSEGIAIAGGYVYRGTAVPALVGHYLFGDIVKGRVFHVPVADLKLGSQATVKELTLTINGKVVTLFDLVGTTNKRVDLRFGQDEAGDVYIMTKQDGVIRKMKTSKL